MLVKAAPSNMLLFQPTIVFVVDGDIGGYFLSDYFATAFHAYTYYKRAIARSRDVAMMTLIL